VTFGFLVAAFLATANPGRAQGGVLRALLAAYALVVAAVLAADELLDLLEVSPESFRIAAGLVLAIAGLRTLLGAASVAGTYSAVVTPELALLSVSAGADEPTGTVLVAAALAFTVAGLAAAVPGRVLVRFLAALQIVVAVALVVSGVQDV
jgi:hypothetical protein